MPINNGVNFTVKVRIDRPEPPGFTLRYFEYIHREAAERKMDKHRKQGCRVMLLDKNFNVLET